LYHDQSIEIPYPPDWGQLWQLEQFLTPTAPGIYPLTDAALRLAAQWGSMEELRRNLEAGLGKELDPALAKKLLAQPQVHVISGLVLEFTDPNELRRLRGKPSFRRVLERMISPHHVILEPDTANVTLRRLQRAGLLAEIDLDTFFLTQGKRTDLSAPHAQLTSTERSFILSMMLFMERLDNHLAAPPGLAARISQTLPLPVRASAYRVSVDAFARIMPKSDWLPEEEPPMAPDPGLIQLLQNAIKTQSSIDVLYHVPQRPEAEFRHLTPIAVEQRGLRYYLIAYCHSRRANRTFRLDRLQYLDQPPL
jgi:hypothetical protein